MCTAPIVCSSACIFSLGCMGGGTRGPGQGDRAHSSLSTPGGYSALFLHFEKSQQILISISVFLAVKG